MYGCDDVDVDAYFCFCLCIAQAHLPTSFEHSLHFFCSSPRWKWPCSQSLINSKGEIGRDKYIVGLHRLCWCVFACGNVLFIMLLLLLFYWQVLTLFFIWFCELLQCSWMYIKLFGHRSEWNFHPGKLHASPWKATPKSARWVGRWETSEGAVFEGFFFSNSILPKELFSKVTNVPWKKIYGKKSQECQL